MLHLSVSELVPILQLAIGPAILISAAGLLILTMSNRFGRVIDRTRTLCGEFAQSAPAHKVRIQAQLQILGKRAQLVRWAMIWVSISVLMAALLIVFLFLAALLRWEAGLPIILLFIGCLGALIAALVLFIQDVTHSLEALELEKDGAVKEGAKLSPD